MNEALIKEDKLGQAITKRFLDPKAPHAKQFIQWIRLLFEIEA